MTNEELIDAFYDSGPTAELSCHRAELLRRLGAAVSASPQPDFRQVVVEILSNCAARYANPDRANWLDPQSVIDKQVDNGVEILAQFFAAAPAQVNK